MNTLRTTPLYLLAFSIYALATLHSSLMQGYFVDGMIYASLARNLAEGYGSFWHLKLSEELFSTFREHPPLGVYIQSVVYSLFGDTQLVDRFYGFIIGFGIMAFMVLIWRRVTGSLQQAWFSLLMFVLFPITGYVLSYNWLEHTLTLAIVAASFCYVEAVLADSRKSWLGWACGAGALVFAGFMIKGPVALYPLVVPLVGAVFLDPVGLRRGVYVQLVSLLVFALSFAALVTFSSEASAFFEHYLRHQVVGSIVGENSTHVRTKLLESLLTEELIAPLVICGLLMLVTRTSWRVLDTGARFRFFLAIALSASLPLMISRKQNDYYLFIAMPFYAMAFAALFNSLRESLEVRAGRYPRRVMMLAFVFAVAALAVMFSKQGDYRKDKAFHQSFSDKRVELPARAMVSACPAQRLFVDWNIAANFQRYYSATLTKQPGHEYLVVQREAADICVDEGKYVQISDSAAPLLLYKRQ